MARFFRQSDVFIFRRQPHLLLAFSWACGLVLGALLFRHGRDFILPFMPLTLSSRLSVPGLASSALLPFLFSVFSVYFGIPWMQFIICLCKAFLYSYISCGVYAFFGNVGWLVHWLLLFADTLSIPVLYLYWLRYVSGSRQFRFLTILPYWALLSSLMVLEYRFIAPLTAAISF